MPKIVITEQDLTRPGSNTENTDVAYIPGFVDVENNFSDYSKALEKGKPTLFTSVQEFEDKCGKKGARFTSAQYFKQVGGGFGTGFADNAVPYNGVMFAANTEDPAYVMAKELLAKGLNVMYERVNTGADDPEYIESTWETQPSNWNELANVLEREHSVYTEVISGSCPELTTKANGKEYNKDATYYTRDVVDGVVKYTSKTIPKNDIVNNVIVSDTIFYLEDTKYALVSDAPAEFSAGKFYQLKDAGYYESVDLTQSPVGYPEGYYTITAVKLSNGVLPESWISGWDTKGVELSSIWTAVKTDNTVESFVADAKYRRVKDDITIKTMYNAFERIFDSTAKTGLMDKGNYSFKYLTSGGYPVYEYNNGAIVTKMLAIAENRGDCVALIDHTDNEDREQNISYEDSLYRTVAEDPTWKANGEFAAMFTPWAGYTRATSEYDMIGNIVTSVTVRLPASFAYLMALADSIKTNANWLAIAGSARGTVINLASGGMTTVIPNGVADEMQPRNGVAINPITNINPYGNIIWGNRTLKNNADNGDLTASSFLNVRNLVSDIKKQAYKAARKLTFEQNNDTLWLSFKALMNPLLDKMVSGYGISGYKMVQDADKLRALGNPKATMCVKIIITPVEPVEDFYVSIILKDDDVSVVEA